jgi:hypothetical protein
MHIVLQYRLIILLTGPFVCLKFQGHDTTSAGISWAMYLLGSHPEVQVNNSFIITKTNSFVERPLEFSSH